MSVLPSPSPRRVIHVQNRDRLRRAIQDAAERYSAAGYFPCACVRVFDAQETLAVACVGGVDEHAVFDVASLTKIATTAQILRLIADGRLSLDTPLGQALPALDADPFLRERCGNIPLRRLLTHTSTLPAWYPFYARGCEDFVTALGAALRQTAPASGVVYSDLNFMLLGKVIERVRDKPLDRCLAEDLVAPLGLGRMTYLPDPALPIVPSSYGNSIEERMCRDRGIAFDGFRPTDRPVVGEANDGNCHYYFHGVSGHAGIFADAAAYERLCRYFMTASEPLLIQAQSEQPGSPGRGLGLQTGVAYPHGCGHTGFTGTGIYFSRERGIGVVSMTNRLYYRHDNPNATGDFRRVLHEIALAYTEG